MKTPYQQELTRLLNCLESLLVACREEDWQSLATHEAQRVELMISLENKEADNSQATKNLLKQVIVRNRELMSIAEKNKQRSENALLDIKRKLKRSTQYQ